MASLVRETQSAVFKGRARNTWKLVLIQHYITQAPASLSTVEVFPEVTLPANAVLWIAKGDWDEQAFSSLQRFIFFAGKICSPDTQADEVNTIRLLRRTLITITTGTLPKALLYFKCLSYLSTLLSCAPSHLTAYLVSLVEAEKQN